MTKPLGGAIEDGSSNLLSTYVSVVLLVASDRTCNSVTLGTVPWVWACTSLCTCSWGVLPNCTCCTCCVLLACSALCSMASLDDVISSVRLGVAGLVLDGVVSSPTSGVSSSSGRIFLALRVDSSTLMSSGAVGEVDDIADHTVPTGSKCVTFRMVSPDSVPFPSSTFLVTTNFRLAAFLTEVGVEPRMTRFSMVRDESLRRLASLFFSKACLSKLTSISSCVSSLLVAVETLTGLGDGDTTFRTAARPLVVDSTIRLVAWLTVGRVGS